MIKERLLSLTEVLDDVSISTSVTRYSNKEKMVEMLPLGKGILFTIKSTENHYGYVYITTNLIDGKIYIGKRKFNPKTKATREYLGSGSKLKTAFKEFGRENFRKRILEYCITEGILNERERFWIKHYDARNELIGYNLSEGGDWGDTLSSFPEEQRCEIITKRNKNIQKALDGVPHSAERNAKKSECWHKQKEFECEFCHKMLKQSIIANHRTVCKQNPNRVARIPSLESRKKTSLRNKGRKHSKESILKMKLAAKEVWRKRKNQL